MDLTEKFMVKYPNISELLFIGCAVVGYFIIGNWWTINVLIPFGFMPNIFKM